MSLSAVIKSIEREMFNRATKEENTEIVGITNLEDDSDNERRYIKVMDIKRMIYIMLIVIFIATVAILILRIMARSITRERFRENQSAWDNYCKNMTYLERLDCFEDWLTQRQFEMGWPHKYIPWINHVYPTVFDCEIDGVQYKGTKEEISKQSGCPIEILNEIGIVPMQIETGRRCLGENQRIEIEARRENGRNS